MKELFKRRFPFLRYKEKDVCAMCIYDTTKVCVMTNGWIDHKYKMYFCSSFKRRKGKVNYGRKRICNTNNGKS